MEALVGSKLVTRSGEVEPTSKVLQGKEVVGLYFSAHWCGPCRGFTPQLAKFYTEIKDAKKFEIVFVSSDRDEASFNEYKDEMPWVALPFEERELKSALSSKYGVRGIPTLVLVDGATGELITKDAREGVSGDRPGFPWRPKSVVEILAAVPELRGKAGPVRTASLAGKHLLVYFSAHWCPPCRGFTPQLATFYNKLKEVEDANFELVFASSDKSAEAFEEYYAEMPWLALPFEARDAKEALSKAYDVAGIPTLVLLGPEVDGKRETITTEARANVADPDGIKTFPNGWKPKPYADVASTISCKGKDINEAKALVVLCELCDPDVQTRCVDALKAVALEAENDADTIFFYATTASDPTVGRIRSLVDLAASADEPTVVVLDIPDNGAYYVAEIPKITTDTLRAFVANPGERKQLG